ncbi:MAG TPA: Mut7-C RNAse domain-containing protein [Rubrobacteraceae bacterium]|nr:Mut7-C RNAse domain-containing protein [Rubrobacteraceae bacterium]
MRFLCDAMLGGLAKWLRAAGHDTYYAREGTDVSDRSLTLKALEEDRVLLTSDGGFLERKPVRDGSIGFLRVPHAPLEGQLRLVAERYDLARGESRCMECNGELCTVASDAVVNRVPPGVRRTHEEFFLCEGCDRVFWHGSHWERISGRLERIFGHQMP